MSIQSDLNLICQGVLYRAFVSLPEYMQDDERTVFFEAPRSVHAGQYLADLLAKAWCINDVKTWANSDFIYNVYSANELIDINISDIVDMRLLETGSGPDGIHYAHQNDVDLFVSPRIARRLLGLFQH